RVLQGGDRVFQTADALFQRLDRLLVSVRGDGEVEVVGRSGTGHGLVSLRATGLAAPRGLPRRTIRFHDTDIAPPEPDECEKRRKPTRLCRIGLRTKRVPATGIAQAGGYFSMSFRLFSACALTRVVAGFAFTSIISPG